MTSSFRVTIKDFTENYEIVGYYRNFGFNVSITVADVKAYVPKSEWYLSMSGAVEEIKYLNEQ